VAYRSTDPSGTHITVPKSTPRWSSSRSAKRYTHMLKPKDAHHLFRFYFFLT
jgi:hypothetical protein